MGQGRRKEREAADEAAEALVPGVRPWVRPQDMTPTGWGILLAVVVLVNFPLWHYVFFFSSPKATISLPYTDDFSDPGTVKRNYWTSGGLWRISDGELFSPGVKNNPLWLNATLPRDVVVEFDARSQSPEGDIKVEIFGDGKNHSSGYVLVHGGWNNSVSIISRLDEHGVPLSDLQSRAGGRGLRESGVFGKNTRTRVEGRPFPVQVGRKYHWRIERRGSMLAWSIDGTPFLSFDDPFPLEGKGHDRFGFSSWEADLYFDNLKIQAL